MESSDKQPNTLTYRHSQSFTKLIKGVKHAIKEDLMDGKKGLSFHYMNKVGDSKFFSITVRQTSEDNFSVRSKTDDNQSDTDVNMVGLMKIIKDNKDLDFVNKYLTDERGKYGARMRKAAIKSRKSKKSKKSKSRKSKSRKSKSRKSKSRKRKSQKGGTASTPVLVGGKSKNTRNDNDNKRKKSRKSRRHKSQKGGHVQGEDTLVGGAKKRRAPKSKSKKSRKSKTAKKSRKSRRRKSQKGGDCGMDEPHLVGGAKKKRSRKSKSRKSKKSSNPKKRKKSRPKTPYSKKGGALKTKNNNVDPDMIILN